jgi:hypothetical protein
VLIVLGAFAYFALPPAFVSVGPFSLGDSADTICHGLHLGDLLIQACK